MMTQMMRTSLLSNYYKVLMSQLRYQERNKTRNKASPSPLKRLRDAKHLCLQNRSQVVKFQVLKLQIALSLMKNQINVSKNPRPSLRPVQVLQHLHFMLPLEVIPVNLVVVKISVSSYLF